MCLGSHSVDCCFGELVSACVCFRAFGNLQLHFSPVVRELHAVIDTHLLVYSAKL